MSENGGLMPEFWIDGFAVSGVPRWAALQAWDEAGDDDTAAQIRRRAAEIAEQDLRALP